MKLLQNLPLFALFWQGAEALVPATQNVIRTSKSAPNPSVFYTFDFETCFAPQRCALFRHDNFQKCSEPLSFFTLLTSKYASRHNGVHFFDMTTSKSVPNTSVFFTFDFEMCLLPQRRALFRHDNFQKCSEPLSFFHF